MYSYVDGRLGFRPGCGDVGRDMAVVALGHKLRWLGLSVVMAPLPTRRAWWAENAPPESRVDLNVSGRGISIILDVTHHFTGPDGLPGKEVPFELAVDFDALSRKPAAYVVLSRNWLDALVVPAAAYPACVRHDLVYACPAQYCLSLSQFLTLATCWESELHTGRTR